MSLGIAFKGPEGIVLAADSRVTLTRTVPNTAVTPPTTWVLPSTYDNATKLLRVNGQNFVGVVTYGLGAIGQSQPRTAHSFMPEFEAELGQSPTRLTVADFARRLSDFFMSQWATAQMPSSPIPEPMVFMVAGFDDGEPYGHVLEFHIPNSPNPVQQFPTEFGIRWGGQREYTDRLIHGLDPNALMLTKDHLNLSDAQLAGLQGHLASHLSAPIPLEFLPLQDCVDLSIFLIRTTISMQGWLLGLRGVGGAIDVATITRTEGLKHVQQKCIVGER